MNIAFLIVGTNLGNKQKNLSEAISNLAKNVGVVSQVSSVYETAPWGLANQPFFYNQAVEIHTSLDAATLLQQLLQIEAHMGRIRTERYGTRIVDIDILFFNHEIITTDSLLIPHPRIAERNFVLAPLAEIVPDWVHPVWNKTIQCLLEQCNDTLTVNKVEVRH